MDSHGTVPTSTAAMARARRRWREHKVNIDSVDANLLQNLCVECASVLQGKYPHVAWGVRPSLDGSMIEIKPIGIGVGKYAFIEKTTVLQQATGRSRLLMRIGGEILERYRVEKIAGDVAVGAKTDRRGELVPDLG